MCRKSVEKGILDQQPPENSKVALDLMFMLRADLLFCVHNINKIETQVALPVFKKLCFVAGSAQCGRNVSMATYFDLTFLYAVL